ncbi:hypothetical protein E5161_10140 [Cohnella pontilimi]|uniref:Uncharacterized protein n=1 Tax=Cohnella pontilimi TaxID=2564100 RepID=A0A4U0FC94_9BACL|nr:hypothetical protein [Cohnella pontilimi]TJY42347.1 hypothetical protein E5161_10140 [Cohnella pontilimi]
MTNDALPHATNQDGKDTNVLELELRVGDALQIPLFQNSKLVAGFKGLSRRIRWVHILESPK